MSHMVSPGLMIIERLTPKLKPYKKRRYATHPIAMDDGTTIEMLFVFSDPQRAGQFVTHQGERFRAIEFREVGPVTFKGFVKRKEKEKR